MRADDPLPATFPSKGERNGRNQDWSCEVKGGFVSVLSSFVCIPSCLCTDGDNPAQSGTLGDRGR